MLQYHSPHSATAAVFNDSLISRHFCVSISAKRLIIGSDQRSESEKGKFIRSCRFRPDSPKPDSPNLEKVHNMSKYFVLWNRIILCNSEPSQHF